MKKYQFWLKYFVVLIVACILIYGLIMNYNKTHVVVSDATKFANEYAALNDQTTSSGKTFPEVSLGDDNAFVYASDDEIKALFDGGTGVIYFGFPECPWCRNAVPVLDEAIRTSDTTKIYYYNIKNIRNSFTFDEDNNLVKEDGTEFYNYLLDKLSNYLTEYYVTDNNKKEVDAGEKRLYAPTVVFIKHGNVMGLHESTVTSQTDPYLGLTDEEHTSLLTIYQDYFAKISESCDQEC
jgi:glutaredoxin